MDLTWHGKNEAIQQAKKSPYHLLIENPQYSYGIINQSTNQPINQSTNQPINQSTNQPINQSTNQPINQSTNI